MCFFPYVLLKDFRGETSRNNLLRGMGGGIKSMSAKKISLFEKTTEIGWNMQEYTKICKEMF